MSPRRLLGWLPQNPAATVKGSSDESHEGSQELPGSDNEEGGSSEASEPIPSYQVPRELAAGRVRGLTRRVSQGLSSQGPLSQRRGEILTLLVHPVLKAANDFV